MKHAGRWMSFGLKALSVGLFVLSAYLPAITLISPAEPRWHFEHRGEYLVGPVADGREVVHELFGEISDALEYGHVGAELLMALLLLAINFVFVVAVFATVFLGRHIVWTVTTTAAFLLFISGVSLAPMVVIAGTFRLNSLYFVGVFPAAVASFACFANWLLIPKDHCGADPRVMWAAMGSFLLGLGSIALFDLASRSSCVNAGLAGDLSPLDSEYPVFNLGYAIWLCAPAILFLSEVPEQYWMSWVASFLRRSIK
jgi:hypothetical protein